MIDFACKQFNIEEIIKCGLGLTKAEYVIFQYFIKNITKKYTTNLLSKKTNFNLTTIQKAVKKLSDQNILIKKQKNLKNGGYIFCYECNSKDQIRSTLKKLIQNWSSKVEQEIELW